MEITPKTTTQGRPEIYRPTSDRLPSANGEEPSPLRTSHWSAQPGRPHALASSPRPDLHVNDGAGLVRPGAADIIKIRAGRDVV